MTAREDAPRWLPLAHHLRATGQPFMTVNVPAHSVALPFRLDPAHAQLPHWTPANEPEFTPKGLA